MKSRVSFLDCVTFVSVSIASLLLGYKLGKGQRRTDAVSKPIPPEHHTLALKDGQTVVAVTATTKSMHFHVL